MPTSLLPALLLQLVLVGFTPGPGNIFALAISLHFDRKTALTVWAGLFFGGAIASCSLAIVVHFVGIALGRYVFYLRYVGALYILFLAYQIGRSKKREQENKYKCSFFSGMLIQLTNAKMLLFDLTVFSTFVLPYSNKLIDLLTASAWLLIAGPGANLTWLLIGSYMRPFFIQHQRSIDVICAITLALCAVFIAF